MGKRSDRNNAGPGAKKFSKISSNASRSSQESLLRRRVVAQKTRLSRALQRSGGDVSKELAVHIDGVESYEEATSQQDEMAERLRLDHLRAVHNIATTKSERLSETEIETAQKLCVPLLLALLEVGDAVEASEILDTWTTDAPPQGRDITPVLYSRALVAFVNWQGGDETVGGDEDICEKSANAALSLALDSNPYVGVFLAHLPIFVREIDPSIAAGALNMIPTNENGGTAEDGSDNEDIPRGKFEGSLEEAMAYAARAAGCWMDFLEQGIDEWVGDQLSEHNEGNIEWPPRRCSKQGKSLLDIFLYAAELAEKTPVVGGERGEAEEQDDEEEEEVA